jgi:NAD(P)-dependent dehydrogenase (short-subunit alcohol dehydrogenase family)
MSAEKTSTRATKVALVTGGSRGVGRSTVLHLAKHGIHSIFTYNSNRAAADSVVAGLNESGGKALALKLDAGNLRSFDLFVDEVRTALGYLGVERFDYLVNNAGNNHHHMPFAKTTEDEFDSLYNVHFKGVYFLTQKLLPLINDGGRIVNISTGSTRLAGAGSSAYASMKGAIEVLTRVWANELGSRGIAVNTVAPGPTATDFSGGIVRDNPDLNKRLSSMTALGRVGLPDDIGAMISSLLSDDNRWVNAQCIEVSGGLGLLSK